LNRDRPMAMRLKKWKKNKSKPKVDYEARSAYGHPAEKYEK